MSDTKGPQVGDVIGSGRVRMGTAREYQFRWANNEHTQAEFKMAADDQVHEEDWWEGVVDVVVVQVRKRTDLRGAG